MCLAIGNGGVTSPIFQALVLFEVVCFSDGLYLSCPPPITAAMVTQRDDKEKAFLPKPSLLP